MNDKYYIKCDQCGELVDVKSPYVVLCPHCKKKMGNSFNQWRVKNEDKTFVDYLRTVCVADVAIEGVKEQRKISKLIKKSRTFKTIFLAFSVSLGITIIVLFSMWLLKGVNSERSIRSILDDNWKINYYEDINSTIKFPFILQSVLDTTLTEIDTVTQVKKIVARQWIKPDVCNITVMQLQYDQKEATREEATTQILQSIIAQNKMEAFQYIPSDYLLGSTKARMLTGTYLISTLLTDFRAVMVTKDKTVWFYMVAYPASMPEGTLLAEKLFKTIQIN